MKRQIFWLLVTMIFSYFALLMGDHMHDLAYEGGNNQQQGAIWSTVVFWIATAVAWVWAIASANVFHYGERQDIAAAVILSSLAFCGSVFVFAAHAGPLELLSNGDTVWYLRETFLLIPMFGAIPWILTIQESFSIRNKG